MLEACRDAGLDPLVTSTYRSPLKQAWLLIRKTAVLLNRGKKPTKARSSAKKLVALPGISEHELGVAFDVCLKQRIKKLTTRFRDGSLITHEDMGSYRDIPRAHLT